ncbi:MAG: hypothetical protein OFPI_19520 [Osedax symbiont Rs2]|nr:MAG: hypothetical protein OFPI_19520 [Osedax symbiont Rs2]
MLPMGSIMAGTMLLGVIFATRLPLIRLVQRLPPLIIKGVAGLVFSGGLWNVLWYASQHLGERWGNAALMSGSLMLITAIFISHPHKLPPILLKIRPLLVLALFAFSLLYGITIYRM